MYSTRSSSYQKSLQIIYDGLFVKIHILFYYDFAKRTNISKEDHNGVACME